MKRTIVLLALALLAFSSPLYAQTHPCDVAQPSSLSTLAGAPLTLSHCFDGKDTTGTVPVTPTGFALYDNGNRTTPTWVKGTTSPASGKTLYTFATTAPATTGLHTMQSAALLGTTEGPKSAPFALTVTSPVPSAPVNLTGQ